MDLLITYYVEDRASAKILMFLFAAVTSYDWQGLHITQDPLEITEPRSELSLSSLQLILYSLQLYFSLVQHLMRLFCSSVWWYITYPDSISNNLVIALWSSIKPHLPEVLYNSVFVINNFSQVTGAVVYPDAVENEQEVRMKGHGKEDKAKQA